MARDFESGSSHYIAMQSGVYAATLDGNSVASFACRVKPESYHGTLTIVFAMVSSTNFTMFDLNLNTSAAPQLAMRARSDSSGSLVSSALTGTALTTGVEYHVGGVVTLGTGGAGSIAVYLDGVLDVNTTGLTFEDATWQTITEAANKSLIGAGTTSNLFFDGVCQQIGLWPGEALTADDFASLAAGYECSMIKPSSLIIDIPFRDAEIVDRRGTATLTNSGSTTADDMLRILPTADILPFVATGAASAPALPDVDWDEVTIGTPNFGSNSLLSLATGFTPATGDVLQWETLSSVVSVDNTGVVMATSLPQTFQWRIWDSSADDTSSTGTVTVSEGGVSATTTNRTSIATLRRRMRRR